MKDKEIPDTVVRSTTIPEELGRVAYLLSDKTGTLTENVMVFKKLHLGTAAYGTETFDEIRSLLVQVSGRKFKAHNSIYVYLFDVPCDQKAFTQTSTTTISSQTGQSSIGKMRRTLVTRIYEAAKAIALCHNVTPIHDPNQIVSKHF